MRPWSVRMCTLPAEIPHPRADHQYRAFPALVLEKNVSAFHAWREKGERWLQETTLLRFGHPDCGLSGDIEFKISPGY